MKQKIYVPTLCLFFLLSLFSFSSIGAETEKKATIVQPLLTKSINSSTAKSGMLLPVNTASATHNDAVISEVTNKSLFLNGLFFGATSIILLLNMISFLLFEEKVFGYFGLAITGTLMLVFGEDNLSALLFQNSLASGVAAKTSVLCITAGVVALYSSQYLTINEYFPRLKTFTLPLFLMAAGLSITNWIVDDAMLPVSVNILSFTLLMCYFGAGVSLFYKNNYSKFFVAGMTLPLLFIFDYFILQTLGIQFLEISLTSVKASFFSTILFMTYATLFRMRDIKEQTALRKTEMELFLKKQEMMERDTIAKLTEDVYLENLIMMYDLDGLEIKLLQYISEGKENKKIAKKFNTTEIDVEEMTRGLYSKIQVGEAVQEDVNLLNLQPDFLYN
tara:strand:+ start:10479 stop:11648 length:1170 start_codon:yes stop_codon:yes gene_type:complete